MPFKPFNSRLELLWTFDDEDTSSSTTTDRSDNSNTGSINGGVTTGFSGVNNGEAFDFNGTDGSVEASDSPSLDITDELTISAWVNLDSLPSSTGTPMDIASKGDRGGANSRYQITIEPNDTARFQITDSTDNSHRVTGSTSLDTNQWYHIAGGFNGDEIEIFVDGVQENSVSHSVTLLNDSQPFFAGRNSYGGGPEWLDGQIDDLRVYSAPLSDDQIATLATFRRGNLQRGLVDHWTMDDSNRSGSTSSSQTPSGNTATLSGNISQTSAPIGDGHQFDGSDDLFEFNSITLDRFDGAVSFWVNPDSASTDYSFLTDTGDYDRLIELEQGLINCETNSNGNRFSNGNYTLRDEWHHLTVVFSERKAFWYEDGEFQNEATNYGIDNYTDENDVEKMVDSVTLSRIGKSAYENKFAGGVSDLRFYDRALSDAEINALYQMRSQRNQNISFWSDKFSSGNLNQWEVNTAEVVSDRVRTGSHSIYCTNSIDDYLFRIEPFGNGKQISKFEYWFQETSSSTGAGVRLKNSDGNYELGVATDNPQWDIDDGDGVEKTVASADYDEWIRFTLTFNWSDGTFDVDFEGESSGTTYTDSGRPLKNGVDVEYIEAWDYYDQWGGTTVDQWYDSFEVQL